MLRGLTTIPTNTRIMVFVVLIISAAVGVIVLSFLRHPWTPSGSRRFLEGHRKRTMSKTSALEAPTDGPLKHLGPLEILGSMAKLACTRNMVMLLPVCIYSGLDLCFYVSILGTSIGYTEAFGDLREALVGLNGVFVGVGQIAGGMLFASLGKCAQKHGRDPALVLGGMLSHFLAYYLVYVSLPANSPLLVTSDPTFIKPNPYIAMFCAALLGFGDAAWINQLCALLGTLFLKDAIVAFAYFQFIQCMVCCAAFFYTPYLTLPYQILINIIGCVAGVFGFCMVEWKAATETQKKARIQSIRDKAEIEALLRIVKPKNGHQTESILMERVTEK
ncbi:hypothetical protein RvY_12976-2 [Ramazzottius varieornatus]|uniref:UNC93-like protein MFSD11 n=1 Tax=Ramazzottius varieornatus TaxID=947166 RepID=A0A1D1VLA6_RAMVA|nr:hypothetical protein RvY_12976-2 [Ramazzottius varieornatus]